MTKQAAAIVEDSSGPFFDDGPKAVDRSDPVATAEHQAVEERAEKRKDYEVQRGQLQRQVDNAQTALATAEDRANGFRRRIKELTEGAQGLWGTNSGAAGISHVHSLAETYTTITALENALLHFPYVKKQLTANLDAAKQRLTEFQKRQR